MTGLLEHTVTYRTAATDDARDIARLFLMSSDGIAEYIWRKIDPNAPDIIDVGEKRYAREDADFGYRNCLLTEVDGNIAGMVHGFSMPETLGEPDPDPDPVLQPYSELEHPGSYYVAGLAVHETHRQLGIGRELMLRAEERAKTLGHRTISLICFTGNQAAMGLYDSLGYRETDRRPIVPVACLKYEDGDAALLVKGLE